MLCRHQRVASIFPDRSIKLILLVEMYEKYNTKEQESNGGKSFAFLVRRLIRYLKAIVKREKE